MKNVIIYNQLDTNYRGALRHNNDELENYLKAQIDNSLRYGWCVDDIIIGTNFDFEYKGIKNHHLHNICDWSGFNNFWYGALELVKRGVIDSNFWLHDHDSWQINTLEFPKFNGDVAGVEYGGTNEWNCGSIYFNDNSENTLQYIVDTLEENKNVNVSSDEVIIASLRRHSPIKNLFVSINSRWNIGLTHYHHRLKNAIPPYQVFSFKPHLPQFRETLSSKNLLFLIDDVFDKIIKTHFE